MGGEGVEDGGVAMNVHTARRVLAEPLVFGDSKQIEALEVVTLYADAETLLRQLPDCECEHCQGKGLTKAFDEWDLYLAAKDENAAAKRLKNLIEDLKEEIGEGGNEN